MKILRVTSDHYPSVVGGIGLHSHEMSRLQAQNGHNVTVLTYRTDSGQPSQEDRDGYHIVRSKASIRIFGNTLSFSPLFFLLKYWDTYDIVHAHSHLFFSTVLCAFVRGVRSTPLVVTTHGLISQTAPRWLQKIYLPTIGKWIFRMADAVICYTEIERDRMVDLVVPPGKVHVIHNGIDTSTFVPSNKISPKKQILWIGRFTPGKGVQYLLEGFGSFSRKFPEYTLVMVGQGPQKASVINLIHTMGLDDKIIIKDFIPNDELPPLYQESSVFILPSLEEGVPRTILEAMACGVPVICSALPHLVNIVQGCGIPIPPRNAEAVSDALIELASNPDLAFNLGQSGRAKVVSQYSWNDTITKTNGLYVSILEDISGDHGSTRTPKAIDKATGYMDSEGINE